MAEQPGKVTGKTHAEHLEKAVSHHARIRESAGERAAAAYARQHPPASTPPEGGVRSS